MSYKIIWTPESERTFNANLEYLSKEWNHQVINTFLDRVDRVLTTLQKNPELYPLHRKNGKVHRCIVNEHLTLFYTIKGGQQIDLLTFWNTHQDPKKLKL